MKTTYTFRILLLLLLLTGFQYAQAQIAFRNDNSKLINADFSSGCAMTIVDWNGDGLDDIIRLKSGHDCYVEVRTIDQKYYTVHLGDFGAGNSAWAMAVADVDHNGYVDVIADGPSSSGIGLIKTNNSGTGGTLTWLANSTFFLQNATFADFNNDGWIDLFCCDDNAASKMYLNDGAGNLLPSSFVNFAVNPGILYGSDPADSGNYGSAWIDFDNDGDLDLFIARCRQNNTGSSDLRRKDFLFVNDGNNNFSEQAASYGIEATSYAQTWTASFGDIDNDADLDLLVTNHDIPSQIFENDGTGHYADITSTTGFDISTAPNGITPIESVFEDFDNDGYLDMLITGSNSRLFHNNGNKTFTLVTGAFNTNRMESFAVGDLNHDGFTDIYGGYATIYTNPTNIDDVIWTNVGNSNHFITLHLKGTTSNHSAIGARALLYSSLGVQLREVRAGESYGTCNSTQLHFGMGAVTVIDSIIVSWPAGGSQTIIAPEVDQFITIIENDCVSPVSTITANGPLHICPGSTLTLSAPVGFNYLWSDGSTNQNLTVSQIGEYNVRVSEPGNNCSSVSTVLVVPDETPAITATGDIEFCDGQSVVLTGPSGSSAYLWSNGTSTQNLTVTQTGTYSLDVMGYCSMWTSNQITVTVHTALLPTANNVNLPAPGSATLNAAGINISWYDSLTGGTLLATGNSLNTPILNSTTTFYAESADLYGGGSGSVGLKNSTGAYSNGNNTNARMFFNVLAKCNLASVKVYTDTPGNRLIELKDSSNAIIHSALVNIVPDSQIITLNWVINPGVSYRISTNTATNQSTLGTNTPRLQRNGSGVSYPYTIQDAISITGSDQGSGFYYYFYDWQIDVVPTSCPSARLPVTVTVGTVGVNEITGNDINVYPNPAKDKLTIESATLLKSIVTLSDQTGRVLRSETYTGLRNTMDIQGIAAGIYHLRIQGEKNEYIYKVVVQ